MNIQEQNYANHLLSLGDAHSCALSWNSIVQASPSNQPEIDFYNYWIPLLPADKDAAEYEVFSFVYDNTDPNIHEVYSFEFENTGNSLNAKCKRRKEPQK